MLQQLTITHQGHVHGSNQLSPVFLSFIRGCPCVLDFSEIKIVGAYNGEVSTTIDRPNYFLSTGWAEEEGEIQFIELTLGRLSGYLDEFSLPDFNKPTWISVGDFFKDLFLRINACILFCSILGVNLRFFSFSFQLGLMYVVYVYMYACELVRVSAKLMKY